MKTVYLIYGISGIGKTWLCDKLSQYAEIVNHDKDKHNALQIIIDSNSNNIIYERSNLISTTITRNPNLNIIPVFLTGDFITCKAQLINRGGRITKSLYKRWKRCQRIYDKFGGIKGNQTDVYNTLSAILLSASQTGIVYKAIAPNNKTYIGITTKTILERQKEHKYSKQLFGKACRKYGDQIQWEQIDQFGSDLEARYKEEKWIRYYKSHHRSSGYNLTFGGEGGKPTEQERARRAKLSKEAIQAQSAEWFQARRDRTKQQWQDPEHRRNTKLKIKQARSSASSRHRTSVATQKLWQDNEFRHRQAKAREEHWNPDNKQKHSERMLGVNKRTFKVVNMDGKEIGRWDNQATASKELGIPACSISRALSSKTHKTHKLLFLYVKI